MTTVIFILKGAAMVFVVVVALVLFDLWRYNKTGKSKLGR